MEPLEAIRPGAVEEPFRFRCGGGPTFILPKQPPESELSRKLREVSDAFALWVHQQASDATLGKDPLTNDQKFALAVMAGVPWHSKDGQIVTEPCVVERWPDGKFMVAQEADLIPPARY